MNQTPGRYQTNVDGSKSKFNGELAVEAEVSYELNKKWRLLSDFGILFPNSEEDHISKQTFWLNEQAAWIFTDSWLLRFGAGVYMHSITGSGGTVAVRNGPGTTNFFSPEQRSTARNVTLQLGLEHYLTPFLSLKVENFLFNPFNSRNRTVNFLLTIKYHLGDILWSKP